MAARLGENRAAARVVAPWLFPPAILVPDMKGAYNRRGRLGINPTAKLFATQVAVPLSAVPSGRRTPPVTSTFGWGLRLAERLG